MGTSHSTVAGTAASGGTSRETVRDETINLLLMGIVGTGKSTTGNKLLQLRRDQFEVKDDSTTLTTECQSEYSKHEERVIKVVDMPGVNDNTTKACAEKQVVEAAINALVDTPNGFDAFLVVIKHGKDPIGVTIITDQLKKMFGSDVFQTYGVLVVTHGDNFKKTRKNQNETYEDYCSRQTGPLKQLWEECGKRMVLFDHFTEDAEEKQTQRKKLFSIVENMRDKPRYKPELFKAAQRTYAEMVKQAKEQALTQSMKESIRLLMHELGDVNVDNPIQSKIKLLSLKSQAEVLLKVVSAMDEASINDGWWKLMVSLKEAVVTKQKLVDMTLEYQASTGDGNRRLAIAPMGSGNQVNVENYEIDDMKKRMTDAEEDLDEKYRSCSKKDTTKMKLKENLLLLKIIKDILSKQN